jgi:hypothetical protein
MALAESTYSHASISNPSGHILVQQRLHGAHVRDGLEIAPQ